MKHDELSATHHNFEPEFHSRISARLLSLRDFEAIPPTAISVSALMRKHLDLLFELREQGFTSMALANELRGCGIEISSDSLRAFLSREGRRRKRVKAGGPPTLREPRLPSAPKTAPPPTTFVPTPAQQPSLAVTGFRQFSDDDPKSRPFEWFRDAVASTDGNPRFVPIPDGRPGKKDILVPVVNPSEIRSGEISNWEQWEASFKK